jgi:hypothetical protein
VAVTVKEAAPVVDATDACARGLAIQIAENRIAVATKIPRPVFAHRCLTMPPAPLVRLKRPIRRLTATHTVQSVDAPSWDTSIRKGRNRDFPSGVSDSDSTEVVDWKIVNPTTLKVSLRFRDDAPWWG